MCVCEPVQLLHLHSAFCFWGCEWVLQLHGGTFSCLFTFTFIYITNASDYCRRLGTVCANTVSSVASTKPTARISQNKQPNNKNNNSCCRPLQRPDLECTVICIALVPLRSSLCSVFASAPWGSTPKVCSRRRAITKTNYKRPARDTNT